MTNSQMTAKADFSTAICPLRPITTAAYIASTEPETYVKELGAQLNAQISDMLSQNNSLSVTDALILCLLNYMDSYRKAEENTDHMRSQLTGYLEDAAKYRIEADEAKREIERLRRELEKTKQELSDAK